MLNILDMWSSMLVETFEKIRTHVGARSKCRGLSRSQERDEPVCLDQLRHRWIYFLLKRDVQKCCPSTHFQSFSQRVGLIV